MTRMMAGLAGLWAAAVLAPCTPAQPKLDRRTTIEVTAVMPRDVYGALSRVLGYELAIAPEIQQPVTMHLENVTVRTALTALSENLGCRWRIDGNTLRVESAGSRNPGSGAVVGGVPGGVIGGVPGGVPGGVIGGVGFKQRMERKTPVDFKFLDTPLPAIIEALGNIAGLEIQVDDPFEIRHVTVDLSNRTVLSALKSIQSETGMVFVVTFPRLDKKMHLKVGLPK
jgi:type II secretory pathway component GspD/PulD (secretin)